MDILPDKILKWAGDLRSSFLLLFLLSACTWHPHTVAYKKQYVHLNRAVPATSVQDSEYFALFLVAARHLDYSDAAQLLKTVAKHPSDCSKNSDVGHAWIVLKGPEILIEGGHSGERGFWRPRYFEGIMDRIESKDPDPVAYLWESQQDGYFQVGSGGFSPTFAAKVNLSKAQFCNVLNYIHPDHYNYRNYALTSNQCTSFVVQVAGLAGLSLESEVIVPVDSCIRLGRRPFTLWTDPTYSSITLASPDILEKSLMQAVREGKAENALQWYKSSMEKKKCWRCRIKGHAETLKRFPERYSRSRLFVN